ncbi:MAG: hypothetical protein RL088_3780 [Verrucomicrobiota bacterium]
MQNLHLSFDVGHSSIGWAVLETRIDKDPLLLGCGTVIFPADDCLASTRRGFRRQRRHIRATRLRIARLKRLFIHLGVLDEKQLDAPGCAWPWLLAARVLRGSKQLTWPELWDVLRWYAHNRGYDGNKAWSRHDAAANEEDTEKELKAHELLDGFAKKHGRKGTMAEVFCDRLNLDPLGDKKASDVRFRDLGAAFPREGVEKEVERILQAQGVEEKVITAIMRDHTSVAGPDYRLPSRYGQLVNGRRTPGGLLFGQLVPRFDNRIIATCPITFQRVYDRVFAETRDKEKATHEAEKLAKVPGIDCVEFYRFRWAMQLANVNVATADPRNPRPLSIKERRSINDAMEMRGFLTPGQFKDTVRAITGTKRDNLDRLLALPDADKSLVLDPARKLVSGGVLGVVWAHLNEVERRHVLTKLRRGKSVTVRELIAIAPVAMDYFERWFDGEAMKKPRKGQEPRTRDSYLDERHSLGPQNGRAAYTREVMREVWDWVFREERHPTERGTVPDNPDPNVLYDCTPHGPLYRSEAIRHAQLQRAIDEQTNNHLVRHRLKLLEKLHADILKEYAGGDKARVERITIEVNRDVKDLSGKTAQEQAKEQGQQTAQFRSVEKKLTAAYEGTNVKLTPGLIRKGRIAEDLGWECPYTGKKFDEMDLARRVVDKDHIIPRSQRASDSLDSLIVTFSEINRMKGNRTAVQFVEEEQGKPVQGLPQVMIKTLSNFLKDVDALETFKGHDDDKRRKQNRKRLLKLREYVEKEFTPGDLTRTSQLVRFAAEALQRAYLNRSDSDSRSGDIPVADSATPQKTAQISPARNATSSRTTGAVGDKNVAAPIITSLPGSVTGAVRKSWKLLGCLKQANQNVLNPDELDEDGMPKIHRKTEIRGITHLHHALDACVLGFISHFLPRDGGAWKKEVLELLSKRRCNANEQAILKALLRGHVTFTPEGQPALTELSKELRQQLCDKLAERRVVQHLPASMADMVSDQTVWRVYDPEDRHENARRLGKWLAEAGVEIPKPDAKTVIIVCRKRKAAPAAGAPEAAAGGKVFHEGKTWRWVYEVKAKDALLGYAPTGDPEKWKLKPYKAVKVLGDNFGIALDPEPTLIRPLHVWRQIQELRKKNGGKWPRILRIGTLVHIPSTSKKYPGIWRIRGLKHNQKSGLLVNISAPDVCPSQGSGRDDLKENVSIKTLIACGLEIIPSNLCGVAAGGKENAM